MSPTVSIDSTPLEPVAAGGLSQVPALTTPAEPRLAAGSVVAGRYAIRAAVGSGAMGIVYAASDLSLGRQVALKLLRPELARDPALSQRFTNEARLTAGLQSPHVVRVYDRGQLPTGEPFLVMEWLEGRSLERMLGDRGRMPIAEAVDLIIQACAGLSEAHAVGIVHRDIKPANLVVSTGATGLPLLKVVDFGISKRLLSGTALTHAGDSVGSPCYMSPEQATGSADVDARSDTWSLGVVLFELVTGRRPFDGGSLAEVFAGILAEPAPSPRALRPELDRGLEAVIWRCLEKDPARRFKDADALRQALTLHGSDGPRFRAPACWVAVDDPLSPVPTRSSRDMWLSAALAIACLSLATWSVLTQGEVWPRAGLDEVLIDSRAPEVEAPVEAFSPRLELPRGVFAENRTRDSGGLALRAEPERQTEAAGWVRSADEWVIDDSFQNGIPVNQVWVRERRFYENGKLVDVEAEVIEQPPSGDATEQEQ